MMAVADPVELESASPAAVAAGARTTVVAVGDVSLGEHPVSVACGLRTRFDATLGTASRFPFEHVTSVFDADVVFCNLETVADAQPRGREDRPMCAHPEAIRRLRHAGVSVANVANNHVLQHGATAFHDTVARLHDEGITVVGLDDGTSRACRLAVTEVNDIRIAWLGYAFETDKYWHGPPLYAFGPRCELATAIAEARRTADIVVLSLHWGDEFIDVPSSREIALGRALIDAGADVVLGHHPHVMRGVERWGQGVIAYSLGNFTFDMLWHEWLRVGLVLRLTVSRRGVERVDTEFVRIEDDCQPRLLAGPARAVAAARLADLSERLQTPLPHSAYRRARDLAIRANRYRSWAHFARTVPRRPARVTAGQLAQAWRRRFGGRRA
jgi:poly-gamma-glutamate synthesis protein (capsule biosynthesis protein)